MSVLLKELKRLRGDASDTTPTARDRELQRDSTIHMLSAQALAGWVLQELEHKKQELTQQLSDIAAVATESRQTAPYSPK